MSIKKFTPDFINSLDAASNPIFVFGSNISGEHVGGAALFALKKFGAVNGLGFGLQGASYAIPTCIRLYNDNGERYTKPFDSVAQIKPFVESFISDAKNSLKNTFYVTKIGCGIAGFKVSEVAELFRPCLYMDNVILPKEFVERLLYPIIINELSVRGIKCNDACAMTFVMKRVGGEKSLDEIINELVEFLK